MLAQVAVRGRQVADGAQRVRVAVALRPAARIDHLLEQRQRQEVVSHPLVRDREVLVGIQRGLVLAAEDDRSRFAALLPPHHVAILSERRILGTLAEALAKLGEGPLPADVTFVSGPSRTADIEQILVIGIHGPTRLDILLVADETGSSEA